MDKPIALAISVVLVVAAMAAVGAIMWTQITNAQEDIDDLNPYGGITNETVCEAAGGTWDGTGKKCDE
ncbi:MAG: hypothetical protein OXF41_02055 [bacterium]|nr:hypothetical protein [bacterium]